MVSNLLGHFRAAKAPIVHVMQEDLPHVSQFLDTQVSLAPTHVGKLVVPLVDPLVRPLVGHTFGFPISG